jgi:NHS family xanthosine MFS transporter
MKSRLTVMSFLQFFIWGAWLLTVANYWFGTKHWDNTEFAAIFSTMGIASVFMPTICGILADRWINAEKLLECCIYFHWLTIQLISSGLY